MVTKIEKSPRTWRGQMEHLAENLKRNKALQSLGNFFRVAQQRGELDAMSIADVKKKVEELSAPITAELSANGPKKMLRLESPSHAQDVAPLTAELSQATSAVTSAKIEIERLQARVKALESKPAAPATPSEPSTQTLSECAKAAFGEQFINTISRITEDEAQYRDRLCRAFHMHAIKVPNLDLSAQVKKVGECKISGFQRVESARMQEAVNNCLQRLK